MSGGDGDVRRRRQTQRSIGDKTAEDKKGAQEIFAKPLPNVEASNCGGKEPFETSQISP